MPDGFIPAEKPPVRGDMDAGSSLAAPKGHQSEHEPVPAPCPLVSGAGTITPEGYAPENVDHIDVLTEFENGCRVGLNPMDIPVDVLTAAGHGPRRTRAVISALGNVPLVEGLKTYKDLRRQCLDCAENSAEVRRCAIIDCPAWPYRMGKNPHNPLRGVNPFASKVDQK